MRQSIEARNTLEQQNQTLHEGHLQQEQALHGERLQQEQAPVVRQMETGADITQPAEELHEKESYRSRKKREEREKAALAAAAQERSVLQREAALLEQRTNMIQSDIIDEQQLKNEQALLSEKLKAINLQEQSRLLGDQAGPPSEIQKQEIRWRAQASRAEAAGEYARMLPLGSAMRAKAMAVKEEQELKADRLRRLLKISRLENPAEQEREKATMSRHDWYDKAKAIFRSDNPLSHEDAVWIHPVNHHQLVNVGRAFFGGTKPMYIFEDRQSPVRQNGRIIGYKQYLFKEAINCVGFDKPEGALVTEAASKLQSLLCGGRAIHAFAAIQNNKVIGSFQEKIETMQGPGKIDLFSWQADVQSGNHTDLPEEIKAEVLREHTLDWLLCNFDTKGENFLHRPDGHLSSFDKEASFGRLMDPGAAHMSTDYKPHANDTLYNTLFSEYAAGHLSLDLSANMAQITMMEAMPRQKYLDLFAPMLNQKYGPAGPKNAARAAAEEAICVRKEHLREEYRIFYESLIRRRQAALGQGGGDGAAGQLDVNGRYRFADEQQNRVQGGSQADILGKAYIRKQDCSVPGIPLAQSSVNGTFLKMTMEPDQAEQMVRSSHGFLTYRKEADGLYTLRPTMPEQAVFQVSRKETVNGKTQNVTVNETVELRKNWKRLTKLLASLSVTPQGQLREENRENLQMVAETLSDMIQRNHPDNDVVTRMKRCLLSVFQSDASLRGSQSAEAAMQELIHFLWIANNCIMQNGRPSYRTIFRTEEIFGPFIRLHDRHAMLTQKEGNLREIIKERDRQEKDQKNEGKADGEKLPYLTDEEINTCIREYIPEFQAQMEEQLRTLARCAGQDMDSEEVFLPGACTASAHLVSSILNPTAQGLQRAEELASFQYDKPDLMENSGEQVRARLAALREAGISADTDLDQGGLPVNDVLDYALHKAANLGRVENIPDAPSITLETYAAKPFQIPKAAFTDEVGVGVYASEEAFKQFYGSNPEGVMSPEQLRRAQLRRYLTGSD